MSEIKHYIYPPTGVEHYGEVIDSKGGFDVIECEVCGFKHIVPIPSSSELNKFYKKKYYEQERKKIILINKNHSLIGGIKFSKKDVNHLKIF